MTQVITELEQRIEQMDPGRTHQRDRLAKIQTYLAKRQSRMNYKHLREQDLEISSGAVEGAVNYVIARRFDSGGMCWIKECAEALLQLRCIEVNNGLT